MNPLRLTCLLLATFSIIASPSTRDVVFSDPSPITQHEQDETARIIRVTGDIRQPGQIKLKPGETITIAEAINRVGGFDRYAAYVQVRVERRQGNSIREIKVDAFQGDGTKTFTLRPGDVVFVPR